MYFMFIDPLGEKMVKTLKMILEIILSPILFVPAILAFQVYCIVWIIRGIIHGIKKENINQ